MKTGISFILFIMLMPASLHAEDNIIGKIVLKEGTTLKTNLDCGDNKCRDDMVVRKGDRIKTGKKGKVQLLLNDGTGIIIYERSDIIINNLIRKGSKRPTELFAEYGKFKIIQNNNYLETSLVITTKNCIVKTVNAVFCLIASEKESGIFVITGEAGFASTESSVSGAYIIQSGEESFIRAGDTPLVPVSVPMRMHSSWLSRMVISKDRLSILRSGVNSGPADWPFMKKD